MTLVLLAVSLFCVVVALGCSSGDDSSGRPAVPPPEIEPGYAVQCGQVPAAEVSVGNTGLLLSQISCGTALHVAGGKAALAGGGRFVRMFVAATGVDATRTPSLLVACENGPRIVPKEFNSSLLYESEVKVGAGERVEGWLMFEVPGKCIEPALVADAASTSVELARLFR